MALRTVAKRFASTSSQAGNFKGIFLPITTPFNADETIAYDKLKHNLQMYEKTSLAGYVVCATNGECPLLAPEERIQLVKFVRENTHKSKVIIGGATSETTKHACEMAAEMAKVGADGIMVMLPFFWRKKITEEIILHHYRTVADHAGIPIVVYNNTLITDIDISIPIMKKLAQHPLITAVKDSDVRKCAGIVQETKNLNFNLLMGSGSCLLPALMNGASGAITGLSGIVAEEMCNIVKHFNNNEIGKAQEIQTRVIKPDILLFSELGPPGLKTAMDMLGFAGGYCRRPLLPTTEANKIRITETLKAAGYL